LESGVGSPTDLDHLWVTEGMEELRYNAELERASTGNAVVERTRMRISSGGRTSIVEREQG